VSKTRLRYPVGVRATRGVSVVKHRGDLEYRGYYTELAFHVSAQKRIKDERTAEKSAKKGRKKKWVKSHGRTTKVIHKSKVFHVKGRPKSDKDPTENVRTASVQSH